MSAPITVRCETAQRLLSLVATVGHAPNAVTITVDKDLPTTYRVNEGTSGTTLKDAAVFLAGKSSADLLGAGNPEANLQFEEYLAQFGELPAVTAKDLEGLNEHLQSRTYLVGTGATLADLAVYAAVAPALTTVPAEQRSALQHLLRWYDHIHFSIDLAGQFEGLHLARPAFVPPQTPPPATAPAAAPGSKKDAAKGGKAAPAASAATPAEAKAAPPTPQSAAAASAAPAAQPKAKKEKKVKEAAPAAAAPPAAAEEPQVDLLDLRVGKIVAVERHPNAESLYVETIDLGEETPRQIVSGLVKFVPLEAMQGRVVVVVTNLKPAKMRDVVSYGMVLCASNDAHDAVDPIIVPEGVAVGERIAFEGYGREPEAQLNPRKKQFEKIAPSLVVSPEGICTYKGVPFMTSRGPITATIPGAHIA